MTLSYKVANAPFPSHSHLFHKISYMYENMLQLKLRHSFLSDNDFPPATLRNVRKNLRFKISLQQTFSLRDVIEWPYVMNKTSQSLRQDRAVLQLGPECGGPPTSWDAV